MGIPRVEYYCCCTPLRRGCVSIAICILVFVIVDTIFTAVSFKRGNENDFLLVLYVVATIDFACCIASVIFAIILMCAVVHRNPTHLKAWIAFTIVYVSVRTLRAILLVIYYSGFIGWKKWNIAEESINFVFSAYLIYCLVVVSSYRQKLKKELSLDWENGNTRESRRGEILRLQWQKELKKRDKDKAPESATKGSPVSKEKHDARLSVI